MNMADDISTTVQMSGSLSKVGEMPEIKIGVSGEYDLIVYNSNGSVKSSNTFKNAITAAGIERITNSGSTGRWLDRAILLSDFFPFADSTSVQSLTNINATVSPYYAQKTVRFRFPVGTATGEVSHVAVGWSLNGLFSFAEAKDSLGNPTTITILEDEFVDVVYRIRLMVPEDPIPFTLNLGASTHTGFIQAQNANSSSFSASSPGIATGWNLSGNSTLVPGQRTMRIATDAEGAGACRPRAYDDDQLTGLIGTPRNIGSFANNTCDSISSSSDGPNSFIATAVWSTTRGNTANGIGRICFRTGRNGSDGFPSTNWNAIFTPRIMKDSNSVLTMNFRFVFEAL